MSLSKYSSTRETTNLARIARIILGPCTDVLRAVLKNQISPTDLKTKVQSYIATKRTPFITTNQKQLVDGEDYSKFDITLLYFLLRNICTIAPHSKQWGNSPLISDRSVSANIERIRLTRNEYYGHYSSFSISKSDFEDKWKYLFQSVKELEKQIGTSKDYQEALRELKYCCMDLDIQDNFIQQLQNDVTGLIDEIEKMKTSAIPWNVKELYESNVLDWKQDDEVYFETHNFPAMLQRIINQSFVIFVGSPGSGKSATAHHIAVKLREEGYEILPTKDIKEIETYCNPKIPQVFVIDDVFGKFGFDKEKFKKCREYEQRFLKPIMSKTKILMTCRDTVFRNEELSETVFQKKEYVIHLHSSEFKLTEEDKYELLAKYNIDKNMLPLRNVSKTSNMFPFLCAHFLKENQFNVYGPKFFISPVPCILNLLNEMQKSNRIQYASLVLLMANQNTLSEDDFENVHTNKNNFLDVKTQVLKKCKVKNETDTFKFVDALQSMDESFTKSGNCQFSFVHDSLFEIVSYHFGCQYPDIILKCMNSDYIANHIKIDKCTFMGIEKMNENEKRKSSSDIQHGDTVDEQKSEVDLYIQLKEPHYQLFAERLYSDIENGEYTNVFRNEALKHPVVAQALIKIIEGKSYTELYSVFFSEVKDMSNNKVLKLRNELCYENYASWSASEEMRLQRTILYCKRVICLVIYFGHHLILQSIFDRIIKKSRNIHENFQMLNKTKNYDSNIESIDYNITGTVWSFLEQHCLLCIGCYSGDLNTIRILLKYIDKRAICMNLKYGYEDLHAYCNDLNLKNSPLVIASKYGFLTIASDLIKHGANINCCDGSNTPLTAACKNGYLGIVIELINAKAKINWGTNFYTPLAAASENGHIVIVKELIKAGADVNIYEDNAPITLASKNGHLIIVQELLNFNANANPGDFFKSPLSAACYNGHLSIAQALIEAGATVNPKYKYETPLTTACKRGNQTMVEALIKAGAKVNLKDESKSPLTISCSSGHSSIVRILLQSGADVNLNDGLNTPLTASCKWGHLSVVEELIKAKANVNLGDGTNTPLTAACDWGQLDTVQTLIREGADVNLLYESKSPLISSCHRGHLSIITYLIKMGADLNLTDGNNTPLTASCEQGQSTLVEELIKEGVDVNFRKPLLVSCKRKHLNIAKQLIKAGVDVNSGDEYGTPLTTACQLGDLGLVEELIQVGADVNLGDGTKTPLTIACKEQHLKIVEELIRAGAVVNLSDKYSTPLTIACKTENWRLVEALIKSGAEVNLRDREKNIPLTVACFNTDLIIVNELIKAGARPVLDDEDKQLFTTACGNGHIEVVKMMIKAGTNINRSDVKCTPLIAAIHGSHSCVVAELIQAGVDVNQCYHYTTPLIAACIQNDIEIEAKGGANLIQKIVTPLVIACQNLSLKVAETLIKAGADFTKKLLKAGPDVNLSNEFETPLTIACHNGNLNLVEELLKAGADVNLKNNKQSPLTVACKRGYLDLTKKLLKAGADVNLSNGFGTPLTIACHNANLNLVEELIKAGAYVNQKINKQSPLTVACKRGYLDLTKKLLKTGADVNLSNGFETPLTIACHNANLNLVKELIKAGADVNIKDSKDTQLIAACKGEHVDFNIVQELINAGADITSSEVKSLLSSLSCNIDFCQNKFVRLKVIEKLLQCGADFDCINFKQDLMTHACYWGRVCLVKEMIKGGVSVNQSDGPLTPLTAACLKGNMNVLEELIKEGADINLKDKKKSTPFKAALANQHLNVFERLLDAGANMNANDDNNKLLLPACVCGSLSAVKELIKAGVDVNQRDRLYETPLTATCVFGHVHVLDELIKAGADLNLRNRVDETPLTVALQRGHFDLVKVLIEAGADENLSDDILTRLNQLHEKRASEVYKDYSNEVYDEDYSIEDFSRVLDFDYAFFY